MLARIGSGYLASTLEFSTQIPIPRSPEGAEPLMGMGLQDRGARAHHFSAFAAGVARDRYLSQTTLRLWQRWQVRKSPLASGLSGSIHIQHHVLLIATIPHSARTGKGGCSLQQIREKLDAQGLDRFLIERRKK